MLQSMDGDGALGLRDASPELLAAACKRTRGFPRALEALAAILAADRDTSLPDLLTTAEEVLPGKIVEVLVGEAFDRLDPLGRQVMQALAVYAAPVPPVAVDYLLQPFQPAIDSGPCCPDWLTCISPGVTRAVTTCTRWTVSTPSTASRQATAKTRTPGRAYSPGMRFRPGPPATSSRPAPPDSWRSLDDLGPQLAEFELRCSNADYDTGAAVLADIDDYLQRWGHYRLSVDLHERINGRLTDPRWQIATANALGNSYATLGQTGRAVEHYQQALAIARETGHRSSEGRRTGQPGQQLRGSGADRAGGRALPAGPCHRPRDRPPQQRGQRTGQPGQQLRDSGADRAGGRALPAGPCHRPGAGHRRAKASGSAVWAPLRRPGADRAGDRALPAGPGHRPRDRPPQHEGLWLGGLGVLRRPGADRAGDRALPAGPCHRPRDRRPRHRRHALGNLGSRYADLGQTGRAIEHYQQALAIARENGDRGWKAPGWRCGRLLRRPGADRAGGRALPAGPCHRPETGDRSERRLLAGRSGRRLRRPGQTGRAIEHYQQALAIAREIGDRGSEGSWLAVWAAATPTWGRPGGRSSTTSRPLPSPARPDGRRGEGSWLGALGNSYQDLGQIEQAMEHYQQAAEIGDDTGNAHSGRSLPRPRPGPPVPGRMAEARLAADAARIHGYGPVLPQVCATLGTAYLREGGRAKAEEAFSAALSAANTLLAGTHGMIYVLYAKGIASARTGRDRQTRRGACAVSHLQQALTVAPLLASGENPPATQPLAPADAGSVLEDIRRILVEQSRDTA